METFLNTPAIEAKDASAWRAWLKANHATAKAVWLVIHHKGSGMPSVYYPEAVDEALCYGWIDSTARKRDAASKYQYFTKRKPKSNWSRVNKEKVARLTKAGKMAPAGLAMVKLAKETGTWDALNDVETLTAPDDLQQALAANAQALTHWEAFPRSAKRGILEWILNAKKPETRAARLEKTVAEAGVGRRANFPVG